MAVDVIQGEASGAKSGKLGGQFAPQRLAQLARRKVAPAGARCMAAKLAAVVHQARDGVARQTGMPADERQMESDAETRMVLGQGDGLVEGRFVDHEAGGGENAFTMGLDNCRVDVVRTSEIVGVDDETAWG